MSSLMATAPDISKCTICLHDWTNHNLDVVSECTECYMGLCGWRES